MAKDLTPEQFSKIMQNAANKLNGNLEKTIKLCCQKVSDDIKYSMDHTARDTSKSYFTNNKKIPHHPSLPDNPPAVDSGRLKGSINYEVSVEKNEVVGRVGSTLNNPDPPYGAYLEFGTAKIQPRPWLRPAMQKNSEFIRNQLTNAVKSTLEGGAR